ncbi:hypothetical protein F5050DRAFT_1794676 [Lentinula boryana]|uniref:Uncharacterized protein n=1 Tax=Lentinula boryana TaxID=40481 RepID=A0ABQ8PXV3_9AGAR|nr:hypothetical protein F5050DRAFT_1794676 [Lentinula boryana]
MRFYTVIIVSSFLATALAAPYAQPNQRIGTPLESRGPGGASKSSGQSLTNTNLAEITFPESDVGKNMLHDSEGPNWELEYFDYSLKRYKGEEGLVLREFGKDRLKDFQQEVEKVKAAGRYVASGIHYDAKSTPLKALRPYNYVIILKPSSKVGVSFLDDPSDEDSPRKASDNRHKRS